MRDVVIIGGGLSGLAAARELEKENIPYTLIEVKPRLGGSIQTIMREGFGLDSGPMFTQDSPFAPFIDALNLRDEVLVAREDEEGKWLAFKNGSQTLIDRLSSGLKGSQMMRMAVSTLGTLEVVRHTSQSFGICMENGMLLDARAIIVASPARFAERMFYTLKQEISYLLLDYRYDSIARISLGYHADEVRGLPTDPPADYPICYIHTLTHAQAPQRVPRDYVLVQTAIRYDPMKGLAPDIVGEFAALMDLPQNPIVEHVAVWPESDPIMWLDDRHAQTMEHIGHMLPEGVALAGSDYVVTVNHHPTLQERIDHGVLAARKIKAWLQRGV